MHGDVNASHTTSVVTGNMFSKNIKLTKSDKRYDIFNKTYRKV